MQNCETQNIADELLVGSYKLDKARKEIEEIVAILVGYLSSTDLNVNVHLDLDANNNNIVFQNNVEFWHLSRGPFSAFFFYLEIKDSSSPRNIVYSMHTNPSPNAEHVFRVRESLNFLSRALVRAYPQLEEMWRPLRFAAQER